MLEPPAISDVAILAHLHSEYGLDGVSLTFLPLGADLSSAVYRAVSSSGEVYFAKLRLGCFDEMTALLPRWLAEQGIAEVMAPLPTRSGRPWAATRDFTLLLYPFVQGRDAYQVALSDELWMTFGRSLRAIHDTPLPRALADRLAHESYPSTWRARLRSSIARLDSSAHADPVAAEFAVALGARRADVLDLIERAQSLAELLRAKSPPYVLCHTDLHAGNLLVSDDGRLFIVDWDAPLLAPRERDLMYPGGGQGFHGRTPDEEEALFYEGYGRAQVSVAALAYYRLERIVEDLAIFCDQLLGSRGEQAAGDSQADREQALRWAMSNFEPSGVLEIAFRTEQRGARLTPDKEA